MYDIVFEKTKGPGGTVTRMSVYSEAAVPRVLYKRCYEKFRRNQKKKSVPESIFCCFLVNFAKFVRTPFFAEQHQTTTSDYSSINSSEGSIGRQNCKLWDRN